MNNDTKTPPRAGPWLGVAGCAITFLVTILGIVVGGLIGWLTSPPAPPQVNEYSGLNEFFETVVCVSGGLLGGGLSGLLVGIVLSILVVRSRGKAS